MKRGFHLSLANSVNCLFQVDIAGIECLADDGSLDTKLFQHFEVKQG